MLNLFKKPPFFSNLFFLYGLKNTEEIPEEFLDTMNFWKKRSPQFHFKLHNQSLNILEKDIFTLNKDYMYLFKKLSHSPYEWILKCDLSRYIYCYHYGMSYSDLDLFPKRNISNLFKNLQDKNIIFVIETKINLDFAIETSRFPIRKNKVEYPYRIANFLMFCRVKKHPIWLDVIETIKTRLHHINKNMNDYDVLYITGPDALTEAVFSNIGKYDDIGFLSVKEFEKNFTTLNNGSWRKA
ncbi:MAG: glycosyltransferase [Candidatus Cloacimonadota bacterium]|nr:glycosyltransferase [Candidatus Cloacimonadota bacterium]